MYTATIPRNKSNTIVVDLREIMNWTPDEYADGKIHGDLDIGPGGDMWFLTYYGPRPTDEEWDTVYRGSWLFHHNIFSGETECLGIPIEGATWPYYNYDSRRGLFFAVCENDGVVLAYDTRERRILYGGAAKYDIQWFRRGTMLDKDTGLFYSTDSRTHDSGERYRGDQHFVSYTRRNNEFTRMNATVPKNPNTGQSSPLRAHTSEKDEEGAFWCFSCDGTIFRFLPTEDRVENIGINWGEGVYTTAMTSSPGGRYLYYIPGAGFSSFKYGTPIVQYDTKTRTKKVLAFLRDYYMDAYGYGCGGIWGIENGQHGRIAGIFPFRRLYR